METTNVPQLLTTLFSTTEDDDGGNGECADVSTPSPTYDQSWASTPAPKNEPPFTMTDFWIILYWVAFIGCLLIIILQFLGLCYNASRLRAEERASYVSGHGSSRFILFSLFITYICCALGVFLAITRLHQLFGPGSCRSAFIIAYIVYVTMKAANYFFFLQRAHLAQGLTKVFEDVHFERTLPVSLIVAYIIQVIMISVVPVIGCPVTSPSGRKLCVPTDFTQQPPLFYAMFGVQAMFDLLVSIFFLYLFGKPLYKLYKNKTKSSTRNILHDRKLKRTVIINFIFTTISSTNTALITILFFWVPFFGWWWTIDYFTNGVCMFWMFASNRRLIMHMCCFRNKKHKKVLSGNINNHPNENNSNDNDNDNDNEESNRYSKIRHDTNPSTVEASGAVTPIPNNTIMNGPNDDNLSPLTLGSDSNITNDNNTVPVTTNYSKNNSLDPKHLNIQINGLTPLQTSVNPNQIPGTTGTRTPTYQESVELVARPPNLSPTPFNLNNKLVKLQNDINASNNNVIIQNNNKNMYNNNINNINNINNKHIQHWKQPTPLSSLSPPMEQRESTGTEISRQTSVQERAMARRETEKNEMIEYLENGCGDYKFRLFWTWAYWSFCYPKFYICICPQTKSSKRTERDREFKNLFQAAERIQTRYYHEARQQMEHSRMMNSHAHYEESTGIGIGWRNSKSLFNMSNRNSSVNIKFNRKTISTSKAKHERNNSIKKNEKNIEENIDEQTMQNIQNRNDEYSVTITNTAVSQTNTNTNDYTSNNNNNTSNLKRRGSSKADQIGGLDVVIENDDNDSDNIHEVMDADAMQALGIKKAKIMSDTAEAEVTHITAVDDNGTITELHNNNSNNSNNNNNNMVSNNIRQSLGSRETNGNTTDMSDPEQDQDNGISDNERGKEENMRVRKKKLLSIDSDRSDELEDGRSD